jgi:hypothetical protein
MHAHLILFDIGGVVGYIDLMGLESRLAVQKGDVSKHRVDHVISLLFYRKYVIII